MKKYAILDDTDFVVGESDSLIGCCRKIAAGAADMNWSEVRKNLIDTENGFQEVTITTDNASGLTATYTITVRDNVEPWTSVTSV